MLGREGVGEDGARDHEGGEGDEDLEPALGNPAGEGGTNEGPHHAKGEAEARPLRHLQREEIIQGGKGARDGGQHDRHGVDPRADGGLEGRVPEGGRHEGKENPPAHIQNT